MPDDRQRAVLSTEHGLWKGGDEGPRRKFDRPGSRRGEAVVPRSPGPEAREAHGEHAGEVDPTVVGQVRARQVLPCRDRAAARPRPVLTQQGPLSVALTRMPGREADAVGGSEEQVGTVRSRQVGEQLLLMSILPDQSGDHPAGVRGGERLGQGNREQLS